MLRMFKSILKSYLFPKTKTPKFRELVYINIPNLTKIAVIFILITTVLVWMGINNGLQEEFQRFKKDPYTTSIFVPSQRFSYAKEQLRAMNNARYYSQEDRFNFSGKGDLILEGNYPFASMYLVFLAEDQKKIFRGRTISQSDQKALEALETYLSTKNQKGYRLTENWNDNEKGIIVSKHLLDRLGYGYDIDTVNINYSFELVGEDGNGEHSEEDSTRLIPISVKVLAVADKMPFGDFIVSNGFYYNYQVARTFSPYEKIEQFHILTPPGKQEELKIFLGKNFNYIENIVKIDERRNDDKLIYRVDFKDGYSLPGEEYERFSNETSKHFILEKIKRTPFTCADDFYEWEEWEDGKGSISPDYLTLYLKEEFVGLLPKLNLFLSEIGVEMDDSIVNIFTNYYEDIARFKKISGVLYVLLVALGILVSVVIYIKSVQATMHRLGVFSTFGVSSKFLSLVLAVESVLILIASLILALTVIFVFPLASLGISVKLIPFDMLKILFIGSALSFVSVFITAKVILKKSPFSLISYRG